MTREKYTEDFKRLILQEQMLRTDLRRNYGLTLYDYDKLHQQQNGVCAICSKPETSRNRHGIRRLSVDHNHDTRKVRALLCNRCNILVGKFENETTLLAQIVAYFVEHEELNLQSESI